LARQYNTEYTIAMPETPQKMTNNPGVVGGASTAPCHGIRRVQHMRVDVDFTYEYTPEEEKHQRGDNDQRGHHDR
jgi:hypothetical protein